MASIESHEQTSVSETMNVHANYEGNATQDPIAICGMSVRLPGKIRNDQGFWELILNNLDARGPLPASRSSVEDASETTKHGYFLDEELAGFDASMTRDGMNVNDPQTHKLLEIVRECLEDACATNYQDEDALVGCYIGALDEDSSVMNCVSHAYNFQGPK